MTTQTPLAYQYHDGGRAAASLASTDGNDSLVRAVALALDKPYTDVWRRLARTLDWMYAERYTRKQLTPEDEIPKEIAKGFLAGYDCVWVPTQFLGKCKPVHLLASELPPGAIICRVSKGWVCVKDGVVYDLEDPRRDGTRMVYGYFTQRRN